MTPEEAEAIVKDPISARDFLACFPTDATFVKLDTAEQFQDQRVIEKRIDFAMENYNTIRDQHIKIGVSSGFLNGKLPSWVVSI